MPAPPSSPSFPSLSPLDSALPSLPVYSPFSHLPFELVEEIIFSSVPLHFHHATYAQRQKTLCSLSLVCRLFHQITAPLLFTVVKWTPEKVEELTRTGVEEDPNRKLCRELALDFCSRTWMRVGSTEWLPQFIEILPILRMCTGLTKLVIVGQIWTVNLLELSKLKHLTALCLSDCDIVVRHSFVFPVLTDLEVFNCWSREWPLSITSFPSLQTLMIRNEQLPESYSLIHEFMEAFEAQLDWISLAFDIILELPQTFFARIKDKTLCTFFDDDIESNELDRIGAQYLEYIPCDSLEEVELFLHQLAALSTSATPSTLFISAQRLPPEDPLRQTLLQVCQVKGIEVVLEEEDGDIVSAEFRRRMRARKDRTK